jgi:Na+/phosphate symporter
MDAIETRRFPMKEKQVFFNPFRIISPKLDLEASRLEKGLAPPAEMTCLEEGLLVMIGKLIQMAKLIHKSLIVPDPQKIKKCEALGEEIHLEEKGLTGELVCSPTTTGEILKALVLFPGRLERAGDFMESIAHVSKIKAKEGIPFSNKAQAELEQLFGLLADVLTDFRDVLSTRNKALLDHLIEQHKKLHQMTLDFALFHEDRLLGGMCSPKASSLYLDILDSIKNANIQIQVMSRGLKQIAISHETVH